jgi:hypothetical protein
MDESISVLRVREGSVGFGKTGEGWCASSEEVYAEVE